MGGFGGSVQVMGEVICTPNVLVHRKYFRSAGGLGMQPIESNAQGSNHSFSAKLPASKQAMVTSTSVDDATTGGSHQV